MTFSEYGSKIASKSKLLSSDVHSVENIDIDSIWSGKAHDKQKNNLSSLIEGLNTQIKQLENLAIALNLIDKYDSAKKEINNYEKERSLLDSSASNYSINYESYTNKINTKTAVKDGLKEKIIEALEKISIEWDQQFSKISKVDIVNTSSLLKTAEKEMNKINAGFDMSNTVVKIRAGITDSPDFSNKEAWVTNNPYSQVGLYGQCTWFAWGKFYEIYGYSPGFTGNGNQCVGQLLNAHGDKFYKSDTPVAGAVFSMGLNEECGHVGIVVDVDYDNNTITIQDGNMNGRTDSFSVAQSDWRTQTYTLSEFNKKRGGVVYANPK